MKQPTVLLLLGKSGTGKSTLARKFADSMSGRMQILQPTEAEEDFGNPVVNWDSCDCLALDDVDHWEHSSVARAVAAFQDEAARFGKKLLLILNHRRDLDSAGIELKSEPAILEIFGPSTSAVFSYQGQTLAAFP